MTDELARAREALAAEIEHLRTERDRLAKQASSAVSSSTVSETVELALERERIAAHTRGQDAHLLAINGSIERYAKAIEHLAARLKAIEIARHEETLVANKLAEAVRSQAEGGLTRKRLYISVVTIVVPLLAVLLATVLKS